MISLRPECQHMMGPGYQRVQRFDDDFVYQTCLCGARAVHLAGDPEADVWWKNHHPRTGSHR